MPSIVAPTVDDAEKCIQDNLEPVSKWLSKIALQSILLNLM